MKQVSTVAVIHNGKILMGKRRKEQAWTCPGGHLDAGEDPIAGAVRELEEESGIRADPKDLKHLKTILVTKKDGEKLRVHGYRLDVDDRLTTSMRGDPDGEVHRWHWCNMHSLPAPLHVPFEHNVLLQALGDEVAMQKTAFWNGFDKAAGAVVPIRPNMLLGAAKQSLGRRAIGLAKANPKTTLGLAAAGGFAAGRATAPSN